MITLYRKNKLGIGTWRIWRDENWVRMAHSSTLGGQEIEHRELVQHGLGGRTLDEQIESRIRSRISKQRDKGYVDTLEFAQTTPLRNQLDLPPPMLAQSWGNRSNLVISAQRPVALQAKYDGFRCMVTRDDEGEVIAYSRQGKLLTALDHITSGLVDLPDGVILDGEVYMHGAPLQRIASLAKRKQLGTALLKYMVYDTVSNDSFDERIKTATGCFNPFADLPVCVVPTDFVISEADVYAHFEDMRRRGYEGTMVRLLGRGYESGHRSSSLLKVKEREDAEYVCLDVLEGSDGCGVLVLDLGGGRSFKTLAPGDHSQKREAVANRENYKGRKVKVEYAMLTDDGVPFHCVATEWYVEL